MAKLEVGKWTKSTKTGDMSCVEVMFDGEQVHTRNSNNRDAGTVLFTPDEWNKFLGGVDAGEFRLP